MGDMNTADLITLTGRGRIDLGVITDSTVDTALHHNAAVAIGVSVQLEPVRREGREPGTACRV